MPTRFHRRRFALVVLPLAFLALFPIGWLGEVWRPLGAVLDEHLSGVEAHALAHAGIFLLLGLALAAAAPALRSRPLLFFGVLLAAALAQEGLQLLYKQRPLEFDELRDLITDAAGMAAAYVVVRRPGGGTAASSAESAEAPMRSSSP